MIFMAGSDDGMTGFLTCLSYATTEASTLFLPSLRASDSSSSSAQQIQLKMDPMVHRKLDIRWFPNFSDRSQVKSRAFQEQSFGSKNDLLVQKMVVWFKKRSFGLETNRLNFIFQSNQFIEWVQGLKSYISYFPQSLVVEVKECLQYL